MEAGGRQVNAAELDPVLSRQLGLAFLPADRQRESGAQTASLRDNISLPVLERYVRFGFLNRRAETSVIDGLLQRFNVRPALPEAPLGTLSGGNQQKALLAKWIQTNPAVLILYEPTQGVDVGSKQDIFRRIEEFSASGVSIIIASAEAEDLARLCHRVVVLRRGAIAAEFSGAALSETAIHDSAFRDTSGASDPAFEETA
jgi:ribose transport system ATP-binding protein